MQRIIFFFLCFHFYFGFCQLKINEFSPSNTWVKADPDFGDYADWIEIYNDSTNQINLKGYSISDKETFSNIFTFTKDLLIPAKSYLVLWADDKDLLPNDTISVEWKTSVLTVQHVHLSFKLKQEGEGVFLKNNSGDIIDSINYSAMLSDVSMARDPITQSWLFDGCPTPGKKNHESNLTTSLKRSSSVSYSKPGGFQPSSLQLELSSPNDASIYYTLDGSLPTPKDSLYTNPITIDKTTTVRSIAIEPSRLKSEVSTQSYTFSLPSLPHFYLTVDSNDLWNSTYGIYTNSRKDHEVPTSAEYFNKQGEPQFQINAGVELFGSTIFQLPQKPFSFSMKGKYGYDVLDHQLFKDKNIPQFKEFVLRNGGNDFSLTMMRDGFLATLASQLEHVDYQAYLPTAVFLNGEYWGLYNVREKLNENYLSSNKLVSPDRLDLLEDNLVVKEGTSDDFSDLLEFITSSDLSNEDYSNIQQRINIDGLIDYMILKSYIGYTSFIVNNKYWRSLDKGGQWNWLSFDLEHAFDCCASDPSSRNTFNFYFRDGHSEKSLIILNKLWENESFKNQFLQRYQTLLQTTFQPSNVIMIIDSITSNIENEMPAHLNRWNPTQTYSNWLQEVEKLRTYAVIRHQSMTSYLTQLSQNTTKFNLELTRTKGGKIALNDHIITDTSWQGKVFALPLITLEAIPDPGYSFKSWKNEITSSIIHWNPTSDTLFSAIFERDTQNYTDTINEHLVWDNQISPYTISGNLVIGSNGFLEVRKGVKIKLEELANIIVHGKMKMNGSEVLPITIESNKGLWGTITLDQAIDTVYLSYTHISGSDYGYKSSFSAITSNQSNLIIDHCRIDKCRQPVFTNGGSVKISNSFFHMDYVGDLVNVTNTNDAKVLNNEFRGNREQDTDAIDFDGVTNGVIQGNWIYGLRGFNSDGIDLGEESKDILIKDNEIYYCSDKGISVGQASTATIKNNIITLCGQGIGVKDEMSTAIVDHNTLDANSYGIASFEKNPGAGGGTVIGHHNLITNSDIESTFLDLKSLLSLQDNLYSGINYTNASFFDFTVIDTDTVGARLPYLKSRHPWVLINEINYTDQDSCFTDEWVELKNIDNYSMNIKEWSFSDGYDPMMVCDSILLDSVSYPVFVRKPSNFSQIHPSIPIAGYFDFKLNNSGERLLLFDEKGMIVNTIFYNSDDNWPTGSKNPLALTVQANNNSLGEKWFANASCSGTPHRANNIQVGIKSPNQSLFTAYPNPTSGILHTTYTTDWSLINLLGDEVKKGSTSIIDLFDLTNGIYFLKTGLKTTRIVLSR